MSDEIRRIRRALRWTVAILWAEARHALVMAGYWIRPYSILLDRRVLRWRRPRCRHTGARA